MGAPVLPSQHEGATQMYINFGSINSRQAADAAVLHRLQWIPAEHAD